VLYKRPHSLGCARLVCVKSPTSVKTYVYLMSNSRWRPLRLNHPSESRPPLPLGSNWLDPLITGLKGISFLSALNPFPFVGRSAENVALLLERLQVIRLLFISEARAIDVSSQKMERNSDDDNVRHLAQVTAVGAPYQSPVMISCTHFEASNSNFYHAAGNQYINPSPSGQRKCCLRSHAPN
jgi:hypothetical protein